MDSFIIQFWLFFLCFIISVKCFPVVCRARRIRANLSQIFGMTAGLVADYTTTKYNIQDQRLVTAVFVFTNNKQVGGKGENKLYNTYGIK